MHYIYIKFKFSIELEISNFNFLFLSVIFEDDNENRLFTSECRTPDRKSGYCMRLTSCVILLQSVNWNRLRGHFCGFEGEEPKVCCPQSGLHGTRRPTQRTTSSMVKNISTPRTTMRTLPIPKTTLGTISTTLRTLQIPNTIRTTPRTLRIPNAIGTTPRALRIPKTIRTTPRTTSSTTFRTTTRTAERTTIHLPEESRNGGSRNIGTTLRPRIDKNSKPPFLPQG